MRVATVAHDKRLRPCQNEQVYQRVDSVVSRHVLASIQVLHCVLPLQMQQSQT